ncbi:DUF565 domain-containing protein [Synechococcus sp. CCY 9618]|uniref:DUF565 domain-containing protein n=1 Tax=Synechococcus sp. CCY 9618 TaxID=2815602 RepID=UPI001C230A08|nr:DUF565 domain-containing protein [Synechococcus sp. CCY 9618]
MTRLPVQRTRFQGLLNRLGSALAGQVRRSWRAGSLSVLALLIGFFAGQNLTSLLLFTAPGGRPAVVLAFLLLVEVMVRLRSRLVVGDPSLAWVILDNLRIGATYSVVLEAFKLGT